MAWVAPRDIAEVAVTRLLSDAWSGRCVQAVHGPADLTWPRSPRSSPTQPAARSASSASPTTPCTPSSDTRACPRAWRTRSSECRPASARTSSPSSRGPSHHDADHPRCLGLRPPAPTDRQRRLRRGIPVRAILQVGGNSAGPLVGAAEPTTYVSGNFPALSPDINPNRPPYSLRRATTPESPHRHRGTHLISLPISSASPERRTARSPQPRTLRQPWQPRPSMRARPLPYRAPAKSCLHPSSSLPGSGRHHRVSRGGCGPKCVPVNAVSVGASTRRWAAGDDRRDAEEGAVAASGALRARRAWGRASRCTRAQ